MSNKQDFNKIPQKVRLNFLANIFHKSFIYENQNLTSRVDASELLRLYSKQLAFNENSHYHDKKKGLEFCKKTLRSFVEDGYMTMSNNVCSPTDKFWSQDEFKDFYEPFKKLIKK